MLAVGSYTAATGGRGPGIALVDRDPATGRLGAVGAVADCPSPSFLAVGEGGVVHAAHEVDEGFVSSRRPGAGGWELLGEAPSGGSSPCHLTVLPGFLVVANYGGGVGVVELAGGAVSQLRQTLRGTGSGPDPDRQESSHPHSTRRFGDHLAVLDLGTDEIRVHATTSGGLSAEPLRTVALAPGTGPRHAVTVGDRFFVAAELDATVTSFAVHGDDLLDPVVASATAVPADRRVYPSEIAVAPWGLVVANRRAEVVTVHEVVDGIARPVRDLEIGGVNPRHVAVVGRHLYVSAQDSDRVVHLALDDDLTVVDRSVAEIGSPACVVPL
ncbi:6-phosphogluconolactonase (cycloisomerase 2 family) [Kineococcus rhizosphaerae]|uniref:6-phosphogluconolactonase (Cycloisomerase 2 family) n=1 Tax=Kineococcus rhizosphaerae TaxID=559628 RepID=A0A2T0R6U9_9ACTN|nr:6-phosphogluconolactonase (cycloisomerase 2 family) [Kineococcus rhizosphaerae]